MELKNSLGKIIFTDLSTYSPKESMDFYKFVFEWKYYNDDDYFMAFLDNRKVSGLYETPLKFKQIGMPHFWMTYIQVDNLDLTVEKAREMGGIIELVEKENPFGPIALIRDPQGAGFTVYAGNQLDSRTANSAGTLIWNELHVSNVGNIKPFYESIFEWKFKEGLNRQYNVYTKGNEHVADVLEISIAEKGKYEYWVSTFGVKDLNHTHKKILKMKGQLISVEGSRRMYSDHSGQAFFYIQEVE